jgi:hypothetical protein
MSEFADFENDKNIPIFMCTEEGEVKETNLNKLLPERCIIVKDSEKETKLEKIPIPIKKEEVKNENTKNTNLRIFSISIILVSLIELIRYLKKNN